MNYRELPKEQIIYDFKLDDIDFNEDDRDDLNRNINYMPEYSRVYENMRDALTIDKQGYNVYLIDDFSKNKLKNIKEFINETMNNKIELQDICYVVMKDIKNPRVLFLRSGKGKKLKSMLKKIQSIYAKSTYEFYNGYEDKQKKLLVENIQKKRNYLISKIIEMAKNEGFVIGNDVIVKVSSAIKNVEEMLSEVRKADDDKAFNLLIALTDEINDSSEVAQLIQKYPPAPVPKISASRIAGEVNVSWEASSSTGNLEYILVRKENTFPNNIEDGTIVYKGKELSFTDADLKKSVVYYYCLFVLRVGVASNAAKVIEPIVIVDNVSNIKSIGGDGLVTITWDKPATVTEVKVWKYKGDSQPGSPDGFESIPCKRLDGVTITGLENGARYWFSICAFHTISGQAYPAESNLINAVPQKPAKPLENFTVLYEDEIFQAQWEESDWDTILFYTQKKPEYAIGAIYNLEDLLNTYTKIDVSLKSLTEAEFTLNFIGECYIIPGVINATNVILNHAAYVSSVPPVKDITYDMNASGTELYVNFTWPKKIQRTAMFYRMDDYPHGPDDPLAGKIECSKRQYESNEGLLVTNPVNGVYYAIIYTYYEGEGHRIYSEGIKTVINNEPQRDVYYSFKYKKGFLSKKRTLTLTVKSSGTFMFPQFAIIGKFKSVPLKRGDGDVVCSLSEETEIRGTRTYDFDVDDIRSGTKLKLFFLNDKQYKKYRVLNDGTNEI